MQRFISNFIFPNCPPSKPFYSSQLHPLPCRRRRRRRRRLLKTNPSKSPNYPSHEPNLRKLTARVVDLTRRKQLHQIFEEVDHAKRRYGKLNIIVMNAVVEACVHCGDVDSALRIFQEMSEPDGCGADSITFATVLKGLGEARRIDEAFQMLESVDQGTAAGSLKLSPPLIYGLLNALLEAVQEICGVQMAFFHVIVMCLMKEVPLSSCTIC